MRVLVTGANGYLGSRLVIAFKATGLDVIEAARQLEDGQYGCDLTDEVALKRLLQETKPDLIVHCAAFVPQKAADYQNKMLSEKNVSMMANIIAQAICPIVYISSMTVYGVSNCIFRVETDVCKPESEYGKSKLDCEELLKLSRGDALSIRIPGLFGGDRNTGLVANLCKSMVANRQPQLPSQPLLWAAMHVSDAVECIVKLCQIKFNGFNLINVGYDEVISVNKLISICEEISNFKVNSNVVHPEFAFDITRLKELGILPSRDLKRAILDEFICDE